MDNWNLAYTWQASDVTPDLTLHTIVHQGDVGGARPLNPVQFGWGNSGCQPNRVQYNTTYPAMDRCRLGSITSETGAQTDITYNPYTDYICHPGQQPPTPASPPSPTANTGPCFPQQWTQGDLGGTGPTTTSWFYKYTVSQVMVNDSTNSNPPLITTYKYCNNASCSAPLTGAAWHYDTDVDLVPTKDKSLSQWRGFEYVHAISGASGDTQSETDYTFMRGMDSNPVPQSGGTFSYPPVTITPTQPSTNFPAAVTDSDVLNGFLLEKIVLNGPGGNQVSDQVNWPFTSSSPTATSGPQPWGQPLTGFLSGTAETDTYTPLSAHANGGTPGTRQTQVKYSYDGTTGLLSVVADLGDVSDQTQASCARYSYPSTPSAQGLINYPTEVKTTSGWCSALSPPLVSDTRFSYDGQAWGTAPTSGNVTETDVYSANDPGVTPHWVEQSRDGYDSYGRLVTSQSPPPQGFTTRYTYTSSFGAGRPTTQVSVQSPLTATTSQTTITDVDPNWGTPDDTIDGSDNRTDYAYDPIGRVTSIWLPGQTGATPAQDGDASYKFAYSLISSAAPFTTTQKLVSPTLGTYVTTYQIYDSLLRPRQTQTDAVKQTAIDPDQTDVTDTYYDSRGNVITSNSTYPVNATASSTLLTTAESAVPSETVTTYDGTGRVTASQLLSGNKLQWQTTTSYPAGDAITVVPPSGGTISTTYADGRGRTTEIDQYHSKTAPSGAYDATSYSYDPVTGKLAGITDPGGNQWTYGYDLLGREISQTTPDLGASASTYNDLGELTSVTGTAGSVVSYAYDAAGRKTGAYAASVSSQSGSNQLDAWTYDSALMTGPGTAHAYGLLASSTSYVGGSAGEAYTETINSYDAASHPISTTYAIPSSSLTGQLAGTYTFGSTYNPGGAIATQTYAAAASLPQETVTYGYNYLDLLVTTFGTASGTNLPGYVWNAAYNNFNQTAEIDLSGAEAAPFQRITYNYDAVSGELSEETLQRQPTTTWIPVDDTSYTYDNSGNVITAGDSVTGNYQCYAYNYLAWLTAAWAQGTACPSSPSTPPGAAGIGGPGAYQQTISYDNLGGASGSTNGTTGTITGDTLISGIGATQTTSATTLTYPAYGAAQPHAPIKEQTSVNGGTATTNNLDWSGTGQPLGYLATTSATPAATYNWNGTGATPGQLAAVTASGHTTSYRYDADGNLLLVHDGAAGTSTLYLPDEEITASGATLSTLSPTRYYLFGSQIVAARTSLSDITWLESNPQGTVTAAIDNSSQNVTHQYYSPYGDLLASTGTATVPGTRGYVGGTADATTELTNLGAREYNPVTPGFISPDPILNPTSPADFDPYSYAYNDPATREDPTGQTVNTYQSCASGDPYCGGAVWDSAHFAPHGGFVDFLGGLVNSGYSAVRSGLVIGGFMSGGLSGAQAVSSILPTRIPIGNPGTTLYGAGALAPLLFPGVDEADGAALVTDSLITALPERLAIAAAPERLAIEAAPARLALPAATRLPPYADGIPITSRIANPGEQFNMVFGATQKDPGGFGTFEDVPSQEFARQKLSILPQFKSDVSYLQRFEFPAGSQIRIQEGVTGAQEGSGVVYPGGATQLEILNFADRALLTPIGDPIPLP